MPVAQSELIELIGAAYDVAAGLQLWPGFLEQYARVLSADAAFFHLRRRDPHAAEMLAAHGVTDALLEPYQRYAAKLTAWRDVAPHPFPQGHVILDPLVSPRSPTVRSDGRDEYPLHLDALYSATGVIARTDGDGLHLTTLRRPAQGPWHESDSEAIARLLPHVTRAWMIQARVQLFEAGDVQANGPVRGMAFMTADGDCILANPAGKKIFRCDDGLVLQGGVLHAADPLVDARLRSMMLAAAGPTPSSGAVLVPRPSLRRPYQVVIAPLGRTVPLLVGSRVPRILVLIDDPAAHQPVASALLMQLYGLTPREAELAAALGAGATVKEAAVTLGMRYETARSHLRRVFDKTRTRRQADLMILVSGLPTDAPTS